MRIRDLCIFPLLLAAVFSVAQTSPSTTSTAETPKQIPNFDLTAIDKTVDPCVDFYQYSCGNWMKNNPIPADKTRWGRFNELDEHNLYILRDSSTRHRRPGSTAPSSRKLATITPRAWTRARSRKKAQHRCSLRWNVSRRSRQNRRSFRRSPTCIAMASRRCSAFTRCPTCTIPV